MAVDGISGSSPVQVPADARAQLAEVSLANARALVATLAVGDIINARVGAALGDGNVALNVRGQTLIANSQTPLLADSLVKLVVQSSGGQPVLRLLDAAFPDQVATSTVTARAVALGLPATAAAATALQAFEHVGAPLDPVRLKEAAGQLQQLPPAQVPARAVALGLLAHAGLPTTPPFIALAERSATGALPNPAAALVALQQTLRTAGSTVPAATISNGPNVQPTGVASALVALPVTVSNQSLVTIGQTDVVHTSPGTVLAQIVVPQPLVSNTPVPVSPLPSFVTTSPGDETAHSTTTVASPPVASSPVGTAAAPTIPVVNNTVASTPYANVPASTSVHALAPVVLPAASGAPMQSALATTYGTLPPTVIPQTTTLMGMPLPDLARGGATAVLQALALAGVRPRETAETQGIRSSPTLLHRLAVPIEALAPSTTLGSATTPHSNPQPPAVEAAIAHVMREQAAETVVKPQALVDYDVVLGLPIQVNGQPLPSRLAVAERETSAGTATFLRVDAELSNLGPLSVRISGIEGGPMAITVLATGAALAELVEALPDLNESLRSLGLTAGLRIADLSEDLARD